ncbi:YciI family protein [Saccharopolyspora phatthalungensis]|uniref:YCII-related domain-containing protein n=1 Tax=Saccharopolyspora phatthalungensis TaxID=664693 RepID=A0A840QJ77_9PSEU|nr:YciI family protein [Saccharopolyspora phatthalungensis]MBB5158959.1 hypothetical protein [Saccharopolyspora phatthalungensis]
MAIFFVRFEHPDEDGWQRWLGPHVDWIREQVERRVVLASGPSLGTPVRQGLLVMRAQDETALRAILTTDPFWEHGIIENLQITGWDPVFGSLKEFSSTPGEVELDALVSRPTPGDHG